MTLSQIWHELLRLSLLGAARNPVAPALRTALAELGIDADASDTELVVRGLAKVRVLLRAEMPLVAHIPDTVPVLSEEEQTVCSRQNMYHLELIVGGEFADALPEFIALMRQHDLALPPEQLPVLLDRCRKTPALLSTIEPLLGERGRWLLHQHPEWSGLIAAIPTDTTWPTLTTPQQVAALRTYRQQEAAAARDLLARHWSTHKAREQERLLAALSEGLSPADASFLQIQLAEGRKSVREAAARLLAQLPDSSIAQHLRERVAACMRVERGQLVIDLPDTLPDEAFAEGIPTKTKKEYGGRKMSWFGWQLERIPPSFWREYLDKQPATILQLMGRSQEAKALLYAIAGATLLYDDTDWQAALLAYYLQLDRPELTQSDRAQLLLKTSTPQQFAELELKDMVLVVGNKTLQDHPLSLLLRYHAHGWSAARSREVVRAMQQALTRRPDYTDLRTFLAQAAYHVDPSLLAEYKTGWPRLEGVLAYNFQWAQQKFLRIVQFRGEMRRAFAGK